MDRILPRGTRGILVRGVVNFSAYGEGVCGSGVRGVTGECFGGAGMYGVVEGTRG